MTIKSIDECTGDREIDLTGPKGNVFFLMAQAESFARQLDRDPGPILADMRSSNYKHAIEVFEREFGDFITLYR